MRYRAEVLTNGLIRVYDYKCQWSGLYYMDGTPYSVPGKPLTSREVLAMVKG